MPCDMVEKRKKEKKKKKLARGKEKHDKEPLPSKSLQLVEFGKRSGMGGFYNSESESLKGANDEANLSFK